MYQTNTFTTLTKHEIVKKTAKLLGVKRDDTDVILSAALNIITESVKNGESIEIRGFGSFYPKVVKSKKVYNFATKESMQMPEKKVMGFKPYVIISE